MLRTCRSGASEHWLTLHLLTALQDLVRICETPSRVGGAVAVSGTGGAAHVTDSLQQLLHADGATHFWRPLLPLLLLSSLVVPFEPQLTVRQNNKQPDLCR